MTEGKSTEPPTAQELLQARIAVTDYIQACCKELINNYDPQLISDGRKLHKMMIVWWPDGEVLEAISEGNFDTVREGLCEGIKAPTMSREIFCDVVAGISAGLKLESYKDWSVTVLRNNKHFPEDIIVVDCQLWCNPSATELKKDLVAKLQKEFYLAQKVLLEATIQAQQARKNLDDATSELLELTQMTVHDQSSAQVSSKPCPV